MTSPSAKSQKPQEEKERPWLALLLLLFAGVLLFLGIRDDRKSKKDATSLARTEQIQEKVDQHMQLTAERLNLQRARMQIENSRLAKDYSQSKEQRPYVAPQEGSELVQEQASEAVAQDLGRNQMLRVMPANPADLINHQLFEQERAKASNEAYRREYARQFIENARRGGWDVKLSEDYRVISVRPYQKPTGPQYQLFHGASGSAESH